MQFITETRLATSKKAKLNKFNVQTNIDKHRVGIVLVWRNKILLQILFEYAKNNYYSLSIILYRISLRIKNNSNFTFVIVRLSDCLMYWASLYVCRHPCFFDKQI